MTILLVRSVLSEHCSSFNCTSNFRKVAKKIADSQTPMIRQTLSHPHQHQEIFFGAKAVESRSTWTTHFGQLFSLPSAVSGQVIPRGPLTSEQSRMFARNHLGQAWRRDRFPRGIINLSFWGAFNLPETSVNSGYVHPIFLRDQTEQGNNSHTNHGISYDLLAHDGKLAYARVQRLLNNFFFTKDSGSLSLDLLATQPFADRCVVRIQDCVGSSVAFPRI